MKKLFFLIAVLAIVSCGTKQKKENADDKQNFTDQNDVAPHLWSVSIPPLKFKEYWQQHIQPDASQG